MSSFIYIAPHIVGTAAKYGYCYDTDCEEFPTREEAQRHGERTLDHDDFWVAEISNARVVALYSGEKKRTSLHEIDDVNKELAL